MSPELCELVSYLAGDYEMLMLTAGLQKDSYTRELEKQLDLLAPDAERAYTVWVPGFPHSAAVVLCDGNGYDRSLSLAENLQTSISPLLESIAGKREFEEEVQRMYDRCKSWVTRWSRPRVTVTHPTHDHLKMLLTYGTKD
jgi:hypothetical protein